MYDGTKDGWEIASVPFNLEKVTPHSVIHLRQVRVSVHPKPHARTKLKVRYPAASPERCPYFGRPLHFSAHFHKVPSRAGYHRTECTLLASSCTPHLNPCNPATRHCYCKSWMQPRNPSIPWMLQSGGGRKTEQKKKYTPPVAPGIFQGRKKRELEARWPKDASAQRYWSNDLGCGAHAFSAAERNDYPLAPTLPCIVQSRFVTSGSF